MCGGGGGGGVQGTHLQKEVLEEVPAVHHVLRLEEADAPQHANRPKLKSPLGVHWLGIWTS